MQLKFRMAFLLSLVFIALPIQAQENDLYGDEKLNGNVHTIRTESYSLYLEVGGVVIPSSEDGWFLNSEIEYDRNKEEIKAFRFSPCVAMDIRKKERLVIGNQIIEFAYGRDGNIEEKIIHTRGTDGRIFSRERFDQQGGLKERWVFRYAMDSNGNWIKRETNYMNLGTGSENIVSKMIERRIITYYANQEANDTM